MNGKSGEEERARESEEVISIIEPSGPKKKKSKVKKKDDEGSNENEKKLKQKKKSPTHFRKRTG
jgi:hypothetical protein